MGSGGGGDFHSIVETAAKSSILGSSRWMVSISNMKLLLGSKGLYKKVSDVVYVGP